MKKHVFSFFVVFSIIFSPVLRAQDIPSAAPSLPRPIEMTPEPPAATSPLATDPLSEPASEQEGTPVGKASQERKKSAKKKQWKNIAIAAGAIAIAVIALILVATNDGHKSHEHK